VHQQDRRRGRFHVVVEESALFGTEATESVRSMPSGGMTRRKEQSERVPH
jgi:hypothetical protein